MSLIKEIVNNLPYLLIYYVPGFCTIFAYRRFRSARSFALVKLRGWRKAQQLYADKLKSSLSDTVFEASDFLMMYMLRFMEKKASVGQISVVW